MAAYAFMLPILPGQEAAERRYIADIEGPRRAEYEATWRQLGVRAERFWHQVTPQGTVEIVYLEFDNQDRLFGELATSDDPFIVWFREQVLAIHGVDLTQPLSGPPNELLYEWHDA